MEEYNIFFKKRLRSKMEAKGLPRLLPFRSYFLRCLPKSKSNYIKNNNLNYLFKQITFQTLKELSLVTLIQ